MAGASWVLSQEGSAAGLKLRPGRAACVPPAGFGSRASHVHSNTPALSSLHCAPAGWPLQVSFNRRMQAGVCCMLCARYTLLHSYPIPAAAPSRQRLRMPPHRCAELAAPHRPTGGSGASKLSLETPFAVSQEASLLHHLAAALDPGGLLG